MPGFTGGVNPKIEFHRSHRWQILDLGIPGSPSGDLRLYAQSLQLPSLEFDIETIKSPSTFYKVAKQAKWKNCVVKFYDTWGLYEEFKNWQDQIWRKDKGLQPASGYKGQPIFALTNSKGEVIQKYTLKGAFPSSVDHGDLSYTNNEIKVLTVTYVYDYAEIKLENEISQAAIDAVTGAAAAAVASLSGLF